MKAVARFLVVSSSIFGMAINANAAPKPWLQFPGAVQPYELAFGGGYGTRSGDLRWNIAGGDNGPNILSELSYEGLEFTEYRAYGSLNINTGAFKHWRIETHFSAGEAARGDVYDSDYDGDNRQGEYSRSLSSAAGSETTQFELSAGYRLQPSRVLSLTPALGVVYNTQFLKMTQGEQLLYTRSGGVQLGAFENDLNSHYTTRWMGGFAGITAGVETDHHAFNLRYKLHVAQYGAEANWNLREDFEHPKSFEHTAVGTGNVVELQYQWRWNDNWSANARAFRETWSAEDGTDTVFLSDGTRASTQLNEVAWDSEGYDLTLQYLF